MKYAGVLDKECGCTSKWLVIYEENGYTLYTERGTTYIPVTLTTLDELRSWLSGYFGTDDYKLVDTEEEMERLSLRSIL